MYFLHLSKGTYQFYTYAILTHDNIFVVQKKLEYLRIYYTINANCTICYIINAIIHTFIYHL